MKNFDLVNKSWVFNKKVAKNFDKHVNQSIPDYSDLQNYIASLSEWFLKDGALIYDLGCSTGETIKRITSLNVTTKIEIIGIDSKSSMLKLAERKNKKRKKNIVVRFKKQNIEKIKFNKCNLVICILTFPFLNNELRKKILKRIYNSLQDGGALIAVDKINARSGFVNNVLNDLYYDFKLKQKITEKDIINKSKSLRSSIHTHSEKKIFEFIKKAGFKEYDTFFRHFNFIGYIAIK